MVTNNSDWTALYANLNKSQRSWRMVEKVLGKTGAPIKAQEMMYKVLVQNLLLYGIKRWLVMDAMMMVLEGFHHKISRHIVEMTDIYGDSREWEWDSVEAALEVACIWPIRKYVRIWKTKIAKYIAGIPI